MFTEIKRKIDKLTYFQEMRKQKDILYSLNSFIESKTSSATSKLEDNTQTPSAQNEGTLRYRTDITSSYVDIVMKTSSGTYEWINIVKNNF